MLSFLLLPLALTASPSADTAVTPPVDTVMVDFPFVKGGPVRLYSLTDGKRDGGRDSISKLEGGAKHVTDSVTYQKLIPLRIEVAEKSDSGTTYRMSYIGYRENPGFKYMWNSSAYRYRYSHKLDYETEPIPDKNIARTVRMTPDLQTYKNVYWQFLTADAGFDQDHPTGRINLLEYRYAYWGNRVYFGSNAISLAFMKDREATRLSANALIFLASSIPFILQTGRGVDMPLNPGAMFGPVGYAIYLLQAAPNASVAVPLYGKIFSFKAGMKTDYFPRSEQGKVAFGVDGGLLTQIKSVMLYLGMQDQVAATVPEATGWRYMVTLGFGGAYGAEKDPYFR
ncbi:MAG TPA: hypothetical protein VHO02_06010 [Fibrobacteria bacterium]|jgi:hypothetical protein|nr:hypothetical protein [Fibrobacteria bacterium]